MPTQDYRNAAGEPVPGTTTVIGNNIGWKTPGLVYWAWALGKEGKDYRKVRDEASGSGTITHVMIECRLNGTEPDLAPFETVLVARAIRAFENFERWMEMLKLEPVYLELPLVSEQHQYGGTIDCVGRIGNGQLAIIDWKTSNAVYADYLVQVCAYLCLFEENCPGGDGRLDGGVHLLRFDKNCESFSQHYWTRDAVLEAWPVFLAALEIEKRHKKLSRMVK